MVEVVDELRRSRLKLPNRCAERIRRRPNELPCPESAPIWNLVPNVRGVLAHALTIPSERAALTPARVPGDDSMGWASVPGCILNGGASIAGRGDQWRDLPGCLSDAVESGQRSRADPEDRRRLTRSRRARSSGVREGCKTPAARRPAVHSPARRAHTRGRPMNPRPGGHSSAPTGNRAASAASMSPSSNPDRPRCR